MFQFGLFEIHESVLAFHEKCGRGRERDDHLLLVTARQWLRHEAVDARHVGRSRFDDCLEVVGSSQRRQAELDLLSLSVAVSP